MKIEKDIRDYADIIGLSRPVSKKHPPMPLLNRAAQFSPFAALNGYEDLIDETARVVDSKIELGESEKIALDRKLNELRARITDEPSVTLSYFVADPNKTGGRYQLVSGIVKKIDEGECVLLLKSGERIPFEDILTVEIR